MSVFYQESRLTGSLVAELLDARRLRIERRNVLGKPIEFTIDVACLAPALSITAPEGLLGLGAAIFFAFTLASLAVYGLFRNELLPPMAWSGVASVALLMTALLSVLFRLRLLRRLTMQTRCAGFPLLVAPVLPDKRNEIEAFLALVRLRIGEAETRRGLDAEHLRSGELKTLRRLANEKVIPMQGYEQAKQVILSR